MWATSPRSEMRMRILRIMKIDANRFELRRKVGNEMMVSGKWILQRLQCELFVWWAGCTISYIFIKRFQEMLFGAAIAGKQLRKELKTADELWYQSFACILESTIFVLWPASTCSYRTLVRQFYMNRFD